MKKKIVKKSRVEKISPIKDSKSLIAKKAKELFELLKEGGFPYVFITQDTEGTNFSCNGSNRDLNNLFVRHLNETTNPIKNFGLPKFEGGI